MSKEPTPLELLRQGYAEQDKKGDKPVELQHDVIRLKDADLPKNPLALLIEGYKQKED